MSPFFFNKRLIVLLVSLIILLALIGYSMKDRKQALWPEQFLNDTVGWIQSAMYQPAHLAAGFFENIEDLKNVYEQNKLLKSRLEENAQMAEDNKRLKKRNKELNKLLDKTKSSSLADYSIRQARVIARSPDGWNEQITINKGKKDGVKKNMAVVSAGGMIGKVNTAHDFSSTVQLVSDLDRTNLISALIQRDDSDDINGMIKGYDPKKKMLSFEMLPYDAKIKEGQTVSTSGLGGIYPQGLEIGKVKDVKPDPQGLTKMAYVKPSANIQELYNVMVVERKAMAVNESDEEGDEQ